MGNEQTIANASHLVDAAQYVVPEQSFSSGQRPQQPIVDQNDVGNGERPRRRKNSKLLKYSKQIWAKAKTFQDLQDLLEMFFYNDVYIPTYGELFNNNVDDNKTLDQEEDVERFVRITRLGLVPFNSQFGVEKHVSHVSKTAPQFLCLLDEKTGTFRHLDVEKFAQVPKLQKFKKWKQLRQLNNLYICMPDERPIKYSDAFSMQRAYINGLCYEQVAKFLAKELNQIDGLVAYWNATIVSADDDLSQRLRNDYRIRDFTVTYDAGMPFSQMSSTDDDTIAHVASWSPTLAQNLLTDANTVVAFTAVDTISGRRDFLFDTIVSVLSKFPQ